MWSRKKTKITQSAQRSRREEARSQTCEAASLRYVGEMARSWATAAGITSRAKLISDSVVSRPRLKRRLDLASSCERPTEVRTCDGSTAPEEQAAPTEQ